MEIDESLEDKQYRLHNYFMSLDTHMSKSMLIEKLIEYAIDTHYKADRDWSFLGAFDKNYKFRTCACCQPNKSKEA